MPLCRVGHNSAQHGFPRKCDKDQIDFGASLEECTGYRRDPLTEK